jgi:hypothetical protein
LGIFRVGFRIGGRERGGVLRAGKVCVARTQNVRLS